MSQEDQEQEEPQNFSDQKREFRPNQTEIKNQVFGLGFGLKETKTQVLISVLVSFCHRYVSFAL